MIAMAAFDPERVRKRKIRRGSSGDGERSPIRTNAAIRAAAPANRPSVVEAPQPSLAARVVAYTSSIRPAVADAAPGKSKWRWGRSARLSCRSTGVSAMAARPTGTLMKKIQDQLRYEVSTPPSRTPAAAPLPVAAD